MSRRSSTIGLAAVVVLSAAFSPAMADPELAPFVHESPDSALVEGTGCTIAVEASTGEPVIRYACVGSPHPLPMRLERSGRGWSARVVDPAADASPRTPAPGAGPPERPFPEAVRERIASAPIGALVTAPDGIRHALVAAPEGIRYVRSDRPDHPEAIDALPLDADVRSLALALASSGEPVAALVTATDDGSTLRLARRAGSTWHLETVDSRAPIACSLALDDRDIPHVAYTVRAGERVRLRYATRALAGVRLPVPGAPTLEVRAGPGIDRVVAHLRAGGERRFTDLVELSDADETGRFTGALAAHLIGARGLELYLTTGTDGVALGSADAPLRLPVTTTVTAPRPTHPGFRPIAAPVVPDSDHAVATLDALAGAGASIRAWDPGERRFRTLSEAGPSHLRPGRGYWLAMPPDDVLALTGDTSFPEPGSTDFDIPLAPGWTLVGNPAAYPVTLDPEALRIRTPVLEKSFARATADGQVRGAIFVFDPANTDSAGWRLDRVALDPWECAWVRNETSATLTLRVPARAMEPGDIAAARAARERPSLPWRLALHATAGEEASAVVLAFAARGEASIDLLDIYMPPSPPERALEVSLRHPGDILTGGPVDLFRDVRAASVGEADWVVHVSSARAPVTLSWDTPTRDAGGYAAAGALTLVDPHGNEWDMSLTRSVSLPAGEHALRVRARPAPGRPSAPATFDAVIRPNPLRAETTFHYELPEPGAVALGVFDISGRRVWSYEQALEPAGGHAVYWDGRDARAQRVQPGTYFLQVAFDAPGRARESLTRKITVLP